MCGFITLFFSFKNILRSNTEQTSFFYVSMWLFFYQILHKYNVYTFHYICV